MFDLQARIHLQKIEVSGLVNNKFNRARRIIINCLCQIDCLLAHCCPRSGINESRGRFFYNLLVPTLDRTLPFVEVHTVAVMISQNLYFDVTGPVDILFYKNTIVAEAGLCLVLCPVEALAALGRIECNAHPFTAAAGTRFQHNGIADCARLFECIVNTFQCFVITGYDTDARLSSERLSSYLIAHDLDRPLTRPNKCNARSG